MATLREIKKRITSIKNTSKITRAMKMVAASKLRRLQDTIIKTRPYAQHMESVIASLAFRVREERQQYPLLYLRPRKTIEFFVLTSDRGLCGAFNTNILKEAEKHIRQARQHHFEVSISVVGKKGSEYFRRRGVTVRKSWTGLSGRINYGTALEIGQDLIDNYISESFDELMVLYTGFKSAMVLEAASFSLLPLEPPEEERGMKRREYLYEPSADAILTELLSRYIKTEIYRYLLESSTSEEAARMVAMENATSNANDMIDSLTLEYNKARQAAITKEILDIIGGVEALS
jgi:F-type H+-transporting ATPase subunit gamma